MKSNFLQGLESDLKSLVRTKWNDCPKSNWSELERRRRRRPDDPHTNHDVINNESSFQLFIATGNFDTVFKWFQKLRTKTHIHTYAGPSGVGLIFGRMSFLKEPARLTTAVEPKRSVNGLCSPQPIFLTDIWLDQ